MLRDLRLLILVSTLLVLPLACLGWMRWRQAESKPFQFSMRRLFIATTLFCVAAALGRFVVFEVNNGVESVGGVYIFYLTFFGGVAAFIAGVGAIVEAQPRKLVRPLAVLLIFLSGLCLLSALGFRH